MGQADFGQFARRQSRQGPALSCTLSRESRAHTRRCLDLAAMLSNRRRIGARTPRARPIQGIGTSRRESSPSQTRLLRSVQIGILLI
jgi:hypothetical protein